MRSLDQQAILVTGSTDGLGREVARGLAGAGAAVLLHGRDETRAQSTLDQIREQTGNQRLSFYLADFSSLAEVRQLAERVEADQDRLDVLVNNAGIALADGERRLSRDGHELTFATSC
jgi:NAD(P)-dependent dehydrogenase (short-subunit alcohol dehydrogenase family)